MVKRYIVLPTRISFAERLAELYEVKSNKDKAALHASKFVELGKIADPELQGGGTLGGDSNHRALPPNTNLSATVRVSF